MLPMLHSLRAGGVVEERLSTQLLYTCNTAVENEIGGSVGELLELVVEIWHYLQDYQS